MEYHVLFYILSFYIDIEIVYFLMLLWSQIFEHLLSQETSQKFVLQFHAIPEDMFEQNLLQKPFMSQLPDLHKIRLKLSVETM